MSAAFPSARRVGVVSDTHGLVRPELQEALAGCDVILHAGDIGGPDVLEALGRIAPVVAVRGNNDNEPWAEALPAEVVLDLAGVRVVMVHDLKELSDGSASAGAPLVVSGHSHRPKLEERGGTTYLNPGSAGPRRFTLPIACAILFVAEGELRIETVDLMASERAPGGRA